MATFLQLAQKVASESGTINGTLPTTVVAQTGRLGKIVGWVQAAWSDIQNRHAGWRWMQAEWTGNTVAATQRYTATALGLTRWAEWVTEGDTDEPVLSAYPQTGTVADARFLRFIPWPRFYATRLRGVQQSGWPSEFTIDNEGRIVLYPVPDAVYVLRGIYRKSAQVLAVDGDVPEAPERHHDTIVSAALVYLATHDEAGGQLPVWNLRMMRQMQALERDQLPPIVLMPGGFA